jgi:hypothetical protein
MLLSLILALGIVWMSARTWSKQPISLGELLGAGDRGRTGDVQLGKLAFYR